MGSRSRLHKFCRRKNMLWSHPITASCDNPNFEHKHWNLEIVQPLAEVCLGYRYYRGRSATKACIGRRKIFIERELRVRPGRDEKILTSWNGLMIKGMARAGRVFERERMGAIGHPCGGTSSVPRYGKITACLATYKDGKRASQRLSRRLCVSCWTGCWN